MTALAQSGTWHARLLATPAPRRRRLPSDVVGALLGAALAVAGTPLGPELRGPIEAALARRLEAALAACAGSTDPDDYRLARAVAREARDEGVQLASPRAAELLARAIDGAVAVAAGRPAPAAVEAARGMVALARELAPDVDLGPAQERLHAALRAPDLGEAGRAELAPLARRLGLSAHPLDVPG